MKIIFTVKMDVWILKGHFCTWTVMSLLIGVFSYGKLSTNIKKQIWHFNVTKVFSGLEMFGL